MAHIIDSRLYGDNFGTSEIREVFSDTTRFQRWLDVEAALALVQGDLEVIPSEAAQEIAARATLENVDLEQVRVEIKITNHSLVPLLRQVQAACRDDLGEWIHYGPTTQDIEDTGAVLEVRDVFSIIRRDLMKVAALLADMAQRHRDTVMTGRTHGQHALVTSFGYRVSIWLREIMRHLQRMDEAAPRIFVASLHGAVGTMSALPQARQTYTALAKRLNLGEAAVSWHTARDGIVEFGMVLAMIAGTIGKIANEIWVMTKTEFGEVAEAHTSGKIGSSTMPHKRNPEISEQVVTLSRLARHQAEMALETMGFEHDRDARAWRMDWAWIPEISCYTGAAVQFTATLLEGLVVNTDRMKQNLRLQRDYLFSEAMMIVLGKHLGKQTAHHLVYEAAMEAHDQDCDLIDRLLTRPEVRENFDRPALSAVTEPGQYLVEAVRMTDEAVALSRKELAEFCDHPSRLLSEEGKSPDH